MPVSNPNANLEAFFWAIGQQESGGNYKTRDSSAGAVGKYQLLPSNIVEWSREMGNPVTVAQFRASPALQEKIARWKLTQYVNKYGFAGAAAAWYSGSPNPNSNAGNPPVHQYVQEVIDRMGKYSARGTGQGETTGGTVGAFPNPLNPKDWIDAFTGMIGVGDLKDMFERLGLILFGGLLVFMGFHILAGPTTEKAKTVVKQFVGVGGSGEPAAEKSAGLKVAQEGGEGKKAASTASAASKGGKIGKVASIAKVAGI